ncbi:MAG TPA: HAD-IIIA family hydrolase [Vicinamibacterales bacterium]|nr:HAD-IIIA family hydrolase [Vicinamibacterales bacterium]
MAHPDVLTRAANARVLLFDVDGVLTDGTVLLHGDGAESKRFHIRDGTAVVLARRAGLKVGLISARPSDATLQRATQLEFDFVHQSPASKQSAYEAVRRAAGVEDAAIAYMGDDLIDLPLLRRVGLAAAPADAVEEVRKAAHWVSSRPGGRGAVREFVELVLKAQGRWEATLEDYLAAQR